jgi:hypothetical protein
MEEVTMTEKAKAVLQKLRQRQVLKHWKRLANPERRDRILDEFNRDNAPDVKPLGGDKGMAVLKEMNDLQAGHDDFVNSLAPRVDVH